jgi:hypothetical protein
MLTILVLYWKWTVWKFGEVDNAGTFGDMFGAANAFFSGLALLGVIYAIILQQKELQLQRLELQETRTELRRSADAEAESTRLRAHGLAMQERREAQESRFRTQQLEPILSVEQSERVEGNIFKVIINNRGGLMKEIHVLTPPFGIKVSLPPASTLSLGERLTLTIDYGDTASIAPYIMFPITYKDALGDWQTRDLRISPERLYLNLSGPPSSHAEVTTGALSVPQEVGNA